MNQEITMGLYGTAVIGIEMYRMGIKCESGVSEEEGRSRCQCVGECSFILCCLD